MEVAAEAEVEVEDCGAAGVSTEGAVPLAEHVGQEADLLVIGVAELVYGVGEDRLELGLLEEVQRERIRHVSNQHLLHVLDFKLVVVRPKH